MTRDQFLTEMMGECWHEPVWNADNYWSYTIPLSERNLSCKKCFANSCEHPDYSTPYGFFRLWNWCKEQEWWVDFWYSTVIPDDFLKLINPEVFANAIARYRGWKEGE